MKKPKEPKARKPRKVVLENLARETIVVESDQTQQLREAGWIPAGPFEQAEALSAPVVQQRVPVAYVVAFGADFSGEIVI